MRIPRMFLFHAFIDTLFMRVNHDQDTLAEHFAGSAIGLFCGDALGMPVEGWPGERIRSNWGMLTEMLPGRFPPGHYTDDTEMMIGILECLAERGRFDPAYAAKRFTANFHHERGYGGRIYGVMDRLNAGARWDSVATDSFGNGGAMRIAPIGFFYFNRPAQLKTMALLSCKITHYHPEALAGAVAQARAVGLAVKWGLERRPIEPRALFQAVALEIEDLDRHFSGRLMDLATADLRDRGDFFRSIPRLFACNVKAIEAVPPAMAAFAWSDSFSEAVIRAVNLGGDTDTIGAMAGALAGAYYGLISIPPKWFDRLENGASGRDYVIDLARKAARL